MERTKITKPAVGIRVGPNNVFLGFYLFIPLEEEGLCGMFGPLMSRESVPKALEDVGVQHGEEVVRFFEEALSDKVMYERNKDVPPYLWPLIWGAWIAQAKDIVSDKEQLALSA